MRKLIVMASIVASAMVLPAQPVAAQECTRGYEKCLNDTHDTSGFTRLLADIECLARYYGCIKEAAHLA